MSRYLTSAIEQGLWSILNLGVNLLLIRIAAPEAYGAFAFWANAAFVLSSLQNALTMTHLLVLPVGSGLSDERLPVERIMHAVTIVFLGVTALAILTATLLAPALGQELRTPAAALFVPAFLLQQYFRTLAFSRGRPLTALLQTAAVLVIASVLVGAAAEMFRSLTANEILILLGCAYGAVGLGGGWIAMRGQGLRVNLSLLQGFQPYLGQSGWLFLGVTTTELLIRFYAFAVAGTYGAAALASLSATQILLRPVPLLATSWSMVARGDLVRRKEAGDWRRFNLTILVALGLGVAVAAVWAGLVDAAWGSVSSILFKGKYAQDGWMVMLWGLSAGLSLVQMVISTPLQVLRAFKALAIANTIASVAAAGAILVGMRLAGPGGAIGGTAAGQLLEVSIMSVMLWWAISRARTPAR